MSAKASGGKGAKKIWEGRSFQTGENANAKALKHAFPSSLKSRKETSGAGMGKTWSPKRDLGQKVAGANHVCPLGQIKDMELNSYSHSSFAPHKEERLIESEMPRWGETRAQKWIGRGHREKEDEKWETGLRALSPTVSFKEWLKHTKTSQAESP